MDSGLVDWRQQVVDVWMHCSRSSVYMGLVSWMAGGSNTGGKVWLLGVVEVLKFDWHGHGICEAAG
jgi:hypothetical protein